MAKKILKPILIVIGAVILLVLAFVLFLTLTEYKPADVEPVEVFSYGEAAEAGASLRIMSWNIGYCGLGEHEDFVMDGGTGSGLPEPETFESYYNGMLETLRENDADIYFLQELDSDSARSYRTNEVRGIAESLGFASGAYAMNYSCPFVPFPWPPMGRINSGIMTASDFAVSGEAERVALPCPFSWPVSTANLKRCLLVTRYDLPGTGTQLVAVNLHLEAYDDGEGKAAQTAALVELLEREYAEGSYVIAGGDFNQTFPGTLENWPMLSEDYWMPGVLGEDVLPEGWSFVYDSETPSCRLNNAPYDSETSQHYVLDGFIVSPNVTVEHVETLDTGFKYSDHSPVLMDITLN